MKSTLFNQVSIVEEQHLERENKKCVFCNHSKFKNIYQIQNKPQVMLKQCLNCYACMTSRFPTKNYLVTYYQNYYKSFGNNDDCITFQHHYRFGKYLSHKIGKYIKKKAISILDFGGGDGSMSVSLAKELINKGFNKIDILVIDLNAFKSKKVNKNITIKYKNDIPTEKEKHYDIVLASSIIEHLLDPVTTLRRLLNALKEDGLFYARTPAWAGFFKLSKFINLNLDFTFPAHLYDLGQDFWETYFSKIDTNDFIMLESNPAIVETSFKKSFFRTFFAYFFKSFWYVFRSKYYNFVGGWEVLISHNSVRN